MTLASAEVELQDLSRGEVLTASVVEQRRGQQLLYYEKPRFAFSESAHDSGSRTPVHFTSLQGDVSIGLSLRSASRREAENLENRGELVVASWDEAHPADIADRRALEFKFYIMIVLQCIFITALFLGVIRDPSKVEKGVPPLQAAHPGVKAPFARQSYADTRDDYLPEFCVEVASAFLAVASTLTRSTIGLTLYILILIILFMVAAASSPTFLHVLRFPIYLALAFFAYKLRNKLMVNWIYDATVARSSSWRE
uniref:Uncharacterized protein n=1 Tax=Rhizochromulina marina TaxID=1034831 RepID=A0A7S2RV70_9STRA|mmetsp:Transcript_20953/g.61168  ORF Transcript_20953/g.61168 Transcript_20953/m.61168 type:complete len:254 (+) Transcript_20953:152-913(+)|eukprot:CAMPEP_0118963284 /NCGR_PEP_ID=MMETSP1173-20130426/1258_1 /TAXON_ID=1034831 /ORGANISM="Rhizochromulina marina cf, Strain CCMP1243" /LENGTH=253 /DNA_ID=CAMNT_0006911607 /DNA_START=108 /DNA_END=869 /DNA_ORIENTATION=-